VGWQHGSAEIRRAQLLKKHLDFDPDHCNTNTVGQGGNKLALTVALDF